MATELTFDSNDLQTDNIITQQIKHESIPDKDAKLFAIAHANKSSIPFVSYPRRKITLAGQVIHTTISGLDSTLDTFKGYFVGTDKNLDIDYRGGTRRYVATVNGLAIDRPQGLTYANFSVELLCTEPFGKEIAQTVALQANGRTLSSYTDAHTFRGTAPAQLPIITITINTVTSGNNSIAFTNAANGQGITITEQTFVANDVIVINCVEKKVTKNGNEIDFLGAFPEFAPGARSMTYSDGFAARNFNISVVYNALWL